MVGGRLLDDSDGWLVGPRLVDRVKPGMPIYDHEVVGPELAVIRAPPYEAVMAIVTSHPLANGVAILPAMEAQPSAIQTMCKRGWSASMCRYPCRLRATILVVEKSVRLSKARSVDPSRSFVIRVLRRSLRAGRIRRVARSTSGSCAPATPIPRARPNFYLVAYSWRAAGTRLWAYIRV